MDALGDLLDSDQSDLDAPPKQRSPIAKPAAPSVAPFDMLLDGSMRSAGLLADDGWPEPVGEECAGFSIDHPKLV